MRPTTIAFAAVVTVCMIGLVTFGVIVLRQDRELSAAKEKAAKLDDYCRYVREGLRWDAREFDGIAGSAGQDEASQRFVENHNYEDILMCATAPIDLSRHDTCMIKRDFPCLAELARAAYNAMPTLP